MKGGTSLDIDDYNLKIIQSNPRTRAVTKRTRAIPLCATPVIKGVKVNQVSTLTLYCLGWSIKPFI